MHDFDLDDLTEFVDIDPDSVHLVGNPASKFAPLVAKSSTGKAGKSMKRKEIVRQLAELRKQAAALDRPASNRGAIDSTAVADRLHGAAFGRNRPFAPFEERVDRAQADLAKAKAAGDEWEVGAAREDLRQATHQLTTLKMISAENARQRDPSIMARRLSGQGVPLISNRRSLPDDPTVRYE